MSNAELEGALPVNVTLGKETFSGASASVNMFVVRMGSMSNGKTHEINLYNIASSRRPRDEQMSVWGVRVLNRQQHPASTRSGHAWADELGSWSNFNLAVNDGIVLKVFAKRKVDWNSRTSTGNCLLRVRAGAAFRRMRIPLTGSRQAAITDALISGRFDILSLEQAEEQYGYRMPAAFRAYFDPAMTNGLFDQIEVIEDQTSAPPVVRARTINVDGQTRRVARSSAARALDL